MMKNCLEKSSLLARPRFINRMKISRRIKKIGAWGISFLILVSVINMPPVARVMQNWNGALYAPLKPFRAIGRGLSSLFLGVTQGAALQEEIRFLREALAEKTATDMLSARDRQSAGAQEFFNVLSNAFSLPIVSGQVVAFTTITGIDTLIINRGSDHAIARDMAAISPEGVFIGKVYSVTPHTASIRLVTDRSSGVAVMAGDDYESQAILKGVAGESLFLDLIPQSANLKRGDIVSTSLIETNTPPGLPIGVITSVHYTEGALFQTADVQPLAPLYQLRHIGIILVKQ